MGSSLTSMLFGDKSRLDFIPFIWFP
jgi:hypothetical protein